MAQNTGQTRRNHPYRGPSVCTSRAGQQQGWGCPGAGLGCPGQAGPGADAGADAGIGMRPTGFRRLPGRCSRSPPRVRRCWRMDRRWARASAVPSAEAERSTVGWVVYYSVGNTTQVRTCVVVVYVHYSSKSYYVLVVMMIDSCWYPYHPCTPVCALVDISHGTRCCEAVYYASCSMRLVRHYAHCHVRYKYLDDSTKHASVRENARAPQPTEQAERTANPQACRRRSPISAVVPGHGRATILARWGVSRGRRSGSRQHQGELLSGWGMRRTGTRQLATARDGGRWEYAGLWGGDMGG